MEKKGVIARKCFPTPYVCRIIVTLSFLTNSSRSKRLTDTYQGGVMEVMHFARYRTLLLISPVVSGNILHVGWASCILCVARCPREYHRVCLSLRSSKLKWFVGCIMTLWERERLLAPVFPQRGDCEIFYCFLVSVQAAFQSDAFGMLYALPLFDSTTAM